MLLLKTLKNNPKITVNGGLPSDKTNLSNLNKDYRHRDYSVKELRQRYPDANNDAEAISLFAKEKEKKGAVLTLGTERKVYIPGLGWQFPKTARNWRKTKKRT